MNITIYYYFRYHYQDIMSANTSVGSRDFHTGCLCCGSWKSSYLWNYKGGRQVARLHPLSNHEVYHEFGNRLVK